MLRTRFPFERRFPTVSPGQGIGRVFSRTEEARGSNPLTSTQKGHNEELSFLVDDLVHVLDCPVEVASAALQDSPAQITFLIHRRLGVTFASRPRRRRTDRRLHDVLPDRDLLAPAGRAIDITKEALENSEMVEALASNGYCRVTARQHPGALLP
jgi:hypothetical protein